jgi:hypothetical protein
MSKAPEPRWSVPFPYGYAGAIENMGLVAAPLLAGFSITLAALVITNAAGFYWTNAILFLLVGATLALIASVQLTFRARQYVVTPSELEEWWADHEDAGRRALLRREQRYHRREYRYWSTRARYSYDAGILLFLAGISALLVPPGGVSDASNGRLAAIALAFAGLLLEALSVIRTNFFTESTVDLPPESGPEL